MGPSNGYRRYHQHQLEPARHIYILRALGLPLEEVREVIASNATSLQLVL